MWTSKILTTNPTIAKAYATLLATQMANHLLISTFILEGETQLVILAIKEKFLSPIQQLPPIIDDISHLLNNWKDWSVSKIQPSQNRCAHPVAHLATTNSTFGYITLDNLPRYIMYIDSGKK